MLQIFSVGVAGLNFGWFNISGTHVYNTVSQKLYEPNYNDLLITEQVNVEAVPYTCTPDVLIPKIGH